MENIQITFLDYNSTTPVDPRVLDAMNPYFVDLYFNPSSKNKYINRLVNSKIQQVRQTIASQLGCDSSEIFFTSGSTESINWILQKLLNNKSKVLITPTEHKAVLDTLVNLGVEPTNLTILNDGHIEYSNMPDESFDLACIIHANNEIGTIHDLEKLGQHFNKINTPFFVDASQSFGKIPINVKTSHIDFLCLSAHKMYGPKGIGSVYISKKYQDKINPLLFGGRQEKGFRSGTLNVPGIIGLGYAAQLMSQEKDLDRQQEIKYRKFILSLLDQNNVSYSINGDLEKRLSNNLNICFHGIDAEKILNRNPDIILSKGSACQALAKYPSHVLVSLGLDKDDINGSLRISFGRFTQENKLQTAISRLIKDIQYQIKLTSL